MFMLRFVVQWFASERRGRSYVPIAFWYFSLIGGLMTFVYAYLRQEPVFMLAQGLGITIYVRNLVLIYRRRYRYNQRRLLDQQPTSAQPAPDDPAAEDTKDAASGAPANR
ncbi:MAG: lipid-A-disaccharide synthase N-terminal domain-containing protein [Planctomycetes bacterium]|nr:lipid-A-disaccharide synthase N-terminal domain-containing protein [Planctomycetota bacterium]